MAIGRSDDEATVRGWASSFRVSISKRAVVVAIFVLDIALIAAIAPPAILGRDDRVLSPPIEAVPLLQLLGFSIWLLPLLLMWSGLYHYRNLLRVRTHVLAFLWIVFYYSSMSVALLLHARPPASLLVSSPLLLAPLAVLAHHFLWLVFLRICNSAGYLHTNRIVVLSLGALVDTNSRGALELLGYRILSEFASEPGRSDHGVRSALTFARMADADGLFLVGDYDQLVFSALDQLRRSGTPVFFLPGGPIAALLKGPLSCGEAVPVLALRPEVQGVAQHVAKRATDVAVAAVALLLLNPALAVIALLIKLDSPGPVIFRQTRLGRHGLAFKIYKFRTMNVCDDGPDVRQAQRTDARVTRVGKWLRKTSLDELPQLVNVLRGDMSLVGPRPHALAHDKYYGERIPEYRLRQNVRPGLTGWAQVNGCRGETPTIDKMAKRLDLDLWYIHHWSEALDIEIMLWTLVKILRSPNAF
jgi:putative colanic acid biosynthesis UDP-glucose lipid carrier transferase